tara:strand:- start:24771 stop:25307 length:537 start_codon:yes stop_codon:yes gene_type:complete
MDPTAETQRWLERIVIGLGICPFAKSVFDAKKIRYQVCMPTSVSALLDDVVTELRYLDDNRETSTTLLIYPEGLESFEDYLDVLAAAGDRLVSEGFEGTYQIASFHPDYVFDGCEVDDAANLTNRAPYPILHILREDEMEKVLATHPSPENIPERNMSVCRELGHEGIRLTLLGQKLS